MDEGKEILATGQKLMEGRAAAIYERIHSLKVVDQDSYALIQDLVKENRKHIDAIEARFKDSVGLAHKAHKEAISLRDEALKRFEENESLGKEKIIQYAESNGERPSVPGISIVRRWSVEIIDEKKIPREYLAPDLKKIQGVAVALGDQCRIPGVIVSPVDSVQVRVGE